MLPASSIPVVRDASSPKKATSLVVSPAMAPAIANQKAPNRQSYHTIASGVSPCASRSRPLIMRAASEVRSATLSVDRTQRTSPLVVALVSPYGMARPTPRTTDSAAIDFAIECLMPSMKYERMMTGKAAAVAAARAGRVSVGVQEARAGGKRHDAAYACSF